MRNNLFIRICPYLILVLLVLLAVRSYASEDAATIARKALETMPPGNWRLSAAFSTRVSRKSEDPVEKSIPSVTPLQNSEYHLTIHLHLLEDGRREIIYRRTNQQGSAEGLRLFLSKETVKTGIEILDLTTDAPVKNLQSFFLDSVFSMEDISLRFLSWKTQKLLSQETLKDRACWKMVSYPTQSDHSAYSYVESWIDQEYQGLLKAIAYDADGRIVKEFYVRSFQQLEEVWMLKMLELNAPLLQARSRLEILDARKEE